MFLPNNERAAVNENRHGLNETKKIHIDFHSIMGYIGLNPDPSRTWGKRGRDLCDQWDITG